MPRLNYPYINRRRYVQLFLLDYAVLYVDGYTDFRYQANLDLYKHRDGLCFHRFFIYNLNWKESLYMDFRQVGVRSVLDFMRLNPRNYNYFKDSFGTYRIMKRKSLLTVIPTPRYVIKKSNLMVWVEKGYWTSHYWTIYRIEVIEINSEKIFICTNGEELYWINKFFLPIVLDV